MPFGSYQTLGEAMSALQVTATWETFVKPAAVEVPEYVRTFLQFSIVKQAGTCSEAAICESLIYPVLRAVGDHYDDLVIWSHVPFYHGAQLLGVPDYLIARRSPFGVELIGTPCAMIMEAKRNDFDAGWGQCLAAMVAAQHQNNDTKRWIYGCVTDGIVWRYAKLQEKTLFRDPQSFVLDRLDELLGALNHVFDLCKQQVLSTAEAA